MRNFGATKLLLLAFVGLLGVMALVNQARQNAASPLPTRAMVQNVFPDITQTQITRMTVENRQIGKKAILVKVPGDWLGTDEKGSKIQVDLNQVTRMLQILSTLRYNRVMEGSDVQAFGLSDGGLFVVSFEAGASYTMHIGDLNSALTFAYVQRDTEKSILQVPAEQVNTLVLMVRDQSP
jgi:hypothetical protein